MLIIPCAREPFPSVQKARRNKQAYHKKLTDAQYPAFEVSWSSKDFYYIGKGNILNSMDSYVRALKPVSAFKFKMKSKLVMDFIDYRVNNFYNCNQILIFVLI